MAFKKSNRPLSEKFRNSEMHKWLEKFLVYTEKTGSKYTTERYNDALYKFFSEHQNKVRPDMVTRRDVENWQTRRAREGNSHTTINADVKALKSFYTWLIAVTDLPIVNPCNVVKRLPHAKDIRCLPLADILKVMGVCESREEMMLTLLLWPMGCCRKELTSVEKKHCDLERGLLIIPPEAGNASMGIKKWRIVPMPETLVNLVKDAPEGRLLGAWAKHENMIKLRYDALLRKAELGVFPIVRWKNTLNAQLLCTGEDPALIRKLVYGAKSREDITDEDIATFRSLIGQLPLL